MYTKKRKPNWFLWCMICIMILLYIIFLLILSDPIKVVSYDSEKVNIEELINDVNDKNKCENNLSVAGCFKTQYELLEQCDCKNQSLSENTHRSEVDVTGCQQEIYDYSMLFKALDSSTYDRYLLAKLVQCEAGNQNQDAKIAVATVVLNRVLSKDFPDTIEEVIFENRDGVYQFTPCIENGSWYHKEPTKEDFRAIDILVEIEYRTDALYFESCENQDNWHSQNLNYLFSEGDIRFYN